MTCFFHLDNFKSQVFTFHSEGITVEFLRERERKKKKLNLLPLDRNIIYQKKKKHIDYFNIALNSISVL